MTQSQRILVCLRYGIGDVVMEMPALRGLRSARPAAEIWLLGARPALELFVGDPDFQALICVQDFGFSHWGDPGDARARENFHLWFTQADIACVLDPFHAVFGIQETLTTTGVAWRNSSPAPQRPKRLLGGHGIAAIWDNAVETWGLNNQRPQTPPPPSLHIPAEANVAADQRLAAWGRVAQSATASGEAGHRTEQGIVGIAPIASSELKRWPIDRVLAVIDWLIRERSRRVLIFGVGSEQPLLSEHLRKAAGEHALAIVAPTHLQETAALASRCQAFVSNDTGLMHMAAAVNTPTVGIFGPTAAHIYLPNDSLAVASDRACDYRLDEQFGPPQCVHAGRCLIAADSCINTIPAEAVTTALDKLLGPGANGSEVRVSWQTSEPSSCSSDQ